MATSKFVTEVLARREISLERTEDLATSMRNTFLGIRRDAQRIVNRNLKEFTESGRYVDTAEARRAADRAVAEEQGHGHFLGGMGAAQQPRF